MYIEVKIYVFCFGFYRLIGCGDRGLKGFLVKLFFDFFKIDKYLVLYRDIIIFSDMEIFVIRYRCK